MLQSASKKVSVNLFSSASQRPITLSGGRNATGWYDLTTLQVMDNPPGHPEDGTGLRESLRCAPCRARPPMLSLMQFWEVSYGRVRNKPSREGGCGGY